MWILLAAGCSSPAPPPSDVAGCGKDTDCKGDRICVTRRCVEPTARDEAPPELEVPTEAQPGPEPVVTPAPTQVAPAPAAEPAPAAGTQRPSPVPDKTTVSSAGERTHPCGCAKDDLMCSMKCAQKGNAAGPSTFPERAAPKSARPCGCAKDDLMCSMKCSAKKR